MWTYRQDRAEGLWTGCLPGVGGGWRGLRVRMNMTGIEDDDSDDYH